MIAEPFAKAVPLLELFEQHGHEAYFVGGAVRDLLLKREISDVDIAVSAIPDEVKEIFPHTADIGIEHGTVLVFHHGSPYEVTTFRTESGYSDHRRPDEVSFVRSLREDLMRRDFTMNAMAMDKSGEIIDPFNGQDAINRKIIVTVGSPAERFAEDALRMMRAMRFSSQIGFRIEPETFDAIKKHARLLEHIAVERKFVEFEKTLLGPYRAHVLSCFEEAGITSFLPGLKGKGHVLEWLGRKSTPTLNADQMWALLLEGLSMNDTQAADFLKAWKLPGKRIKDIRGMLRWLQYRKEHEWNRESAYEAGKEWMISAEALYLTISDKPLAQYEEALIDLYASLPIKSRSELAVTGNDLIGWTGHRPGPWIKECLSLAERTVVNGTVANEKEQLKEWLSRCRMI